MAGQWKAKTIEKSEVDSGGGFIVRFDIKKGQNVIFPNLTISTTPSTYKDDIKRKAGDLITSYEQGLLVPDAETIDLD